MNEHGPHEFDPRHFRFERSSGLGRDYFATPSRWRRYRVAAIVYLAIAALFFFGFWLTAAEVDDELIRPDSAPVSSVGQSTKGTAP